MADQPKVPANRIVDYGNGPSVFGTKIVSTRFDAGVITITLGVTEYQGERHTDPPDGDKEVIAIVGKLTLTHLAAVELINSIGTLLNGIAAHQAKKPEAGIN